MDRFATLREQLSQPPSQENWYALIRQLLSWPSQPDRDVALHYAEAHLSHWHDEVRAIKDGLRQEYGQTPAHPCWQLVRSFYIFIRDLRAQEHTYSLKTLQHVPHITTLRLIFHPEFLFNSLPPRKNGSSYTSQPFRRTWERTSETPNDKNTSYPQLCLQDIEGFEELEKLEHLNHLELYSYPLRQLGPLPHLKALTHFTLSGHTGLDDLDTLTAFPQLTHLQLEDCPLISLQHREELPHLTHLTIQNGSWPKEFNWSIFGHLTHLQLFGERDNYLLDEIDLSPLQKLTHLSIKGHVNSLQKPGLDALASLQQLTHLELDAFTPQPHIHPLQHLKSLTHLTLSGLGRWYHQDLSALSYLTKLRSLQLKNCSRLMLDLFARLPELHTLSLEFDNQSIESMELRERSEAIAEFRYPMALTQLAGLKELTLKKCRYLQDLEFVEGLPLLEKIELRGCSALHWLRDLKGCQQLTHITLEGCKQIEHLDGFARPKLPPLFRWGGVEASQEGDGLTRLREFSVSNFPHLRDIEGLSTYESLHRITLHNCPQLRYVGALHELGDLRSLHIEDCPALEDLSAIISLRKLVRLEIRACGSLSCPPEQPLMQTRKEVERYQQRLLKFQTEQEASD